ncbi:hypothetical protein KIH27_20495 [Mycobacterium sp. M1]|uniref:Uncharacterized protein n=1 Tax=Mycolicibacter acidiphilus TaxID=2835306 RepID=A0ABS5RNT3_9MYCO|nr:hypothetical protein [Mycolicibacter acidiphilus]MBS9535967.1 hypothetical protein [Mycolicibacter acidiphilus]
MTLVLAQRVSPMPGAAVWAAGRRLVARLRRFGGPTLPTPQQRTDRYLSLMPIAVLAAS